MNNPVLQIIPTDKPNLNAPLQMLPAERQEAIYEYLDKHSLRETVTWLAKAGILTSKSALDRWRGWYVRRLQHEANSDYWSDIKKEIQDENPENAEKEIFKKGQMLFSRLAQEQEDYKAWARVQSLRFKAMQIALAFNLFALREKECAHKNGTGTSGGLSLKTFEEIERELNLL